MREPQNVRYLAAHETMIARSVYIDTIPYGLVLISDGLGGGDRPFTVPTILPIHIPFYNFNVKGDGKYVIHAGDGYYGMSTLFKDKKTLIHELAHVWQGEHYKSWSWTYAVFSLKDQALSGDAAYAYDKTHLRPWDDYGPEQQAQIVEDWFADGMKTYDPTTDTGDLRFYYIKKHIRGEPVAGDWLMPVIKPLPEGRLEVKEFPSWPLDGQLLPTLERPLRADDQAGIAARRRDIEDAFQRISPGFARDLISRLESRRPNDKLAQSFHYRLSTPERQKLLHILRTKLTRL